jgi:ABC-type Fe3+ transport system permease subunit
MTYLGVILGLGILSVTVYMALDKKSNLQTRIACLIAIALMLITVIICVVTVLTDNRVPVDESVLIVGAPVETKKAGSGNTMVLLLVIIFIVLLFIFITIMAMRENRKNKKKESEKSSLIL